MATLSAVKTNPVIGIPRIRDVKVHVDERNELVKSVNYKPPRRDDFRLENKG